MPNFLQISAPFSYCHSSSNFVRPEPIMSKPPVLRYSSTISLVSSIYSCSTKPLGPPKKPYNLLLGFKAFKPSYKPEITLCPPGACPPERITPTPTVGFSFFAPVSKVTSGIP